MKRIAMWVAIGVIIGAEASGGQAPTKDATRTAGGGTDTPLDCGPVKRVRSVADLVALAPPQWIKARRREDFTGSGPITTPDLRATVALSAGTDDFVPRSTGVPISQARIRKIVPGLRYGPGKVIIEPGATFRMRFAMHAPLPSPKEPTVVFEAPCRAPCAAGERRCVAAGTCYAEGGEYCLQCDRRSPRLCACVGLDGSAKPDGTECTFMEGDYGTSGRCSAGECRTR